MKVLLGILGMALLLMPTGWIDRFWRLLFGKRDDSRS
jgi:hypothetical protein